MTTLIRIPSFDMAQLSLDETYNLASLARRKSSTSSQKLNLRQKLGTAQLLEAVETAIRNSPPPSPQPSYQKPQSQHISWATLNTTKQEARPEVDEYGFAYDDEEDEDDGLSLCRTQSRSP